MNINRLFKDLIRQIDPSIDAKMHLPDNWESLIDEGKFVALVYIVGGDQVDGGSEDESRIRVDLYGLGTDDTLDKAEELRERLVWDRFACSYHFVNGQMIDDVTAAILPAPIPTDLDRVSLVSTTYLISNRDRRTVAP